MGATMAIRGEIPLLTSRPLREVQSGGPDPFTATGPASLAWVRLEV